MAINTGHGFDLGPIPDNWRDLCRCAKVDTSPSEATITDDPLGVRHDRELARAVDLLTSLKPSSEATDMSHQVCEQEVAPSPRLTDPSDIRQMCEVGYATLYAKNPTIKAIMASAEHHYKNMLDNLETQLFGDASLDWTAPTLISIDPVSGLDVRNVDIWSDQSGPVDDVSPAMAHSENILVCDLRSQRAVDALRAEIAAKDARIAELKSELARRPAAFVDPDEKPEHNPFREVTKDRRMMGP